jgi:DNA-directed RNA polymerase specialized sigma24 family protein
MPPDEGFLELIERVRAGDEQASTELVRLYEPVIRVAVRARLTDPRLRRLLDSTDVCQSVLGNFFGRATSGQFELKDPKQLIGLLVTMARNRITSHALEQRAARRDHRRDRNLPQDALEPVDPRQGPGSAAEGRDLLEAAHDRMSPEERLIAEQWASGNAWAEIGAKIGARPDALRIRLGRALDRVRRELRLIK